MPGERYGTGRQVRVRTLKQIRARDQRGALIGDRKVKMASPKVVVVVGWIASTCVLLALSSASCWGASTEHCFSRGFSTSLMCSSCRELKQFALQALEAECLGCCQEDGAASEEKVRAVRCL